ncbi:MAG: IS200/IS605 family transposase [Gemmatimonadales bacterium]
MAGTYARVRVHVVWSTRRRRPWLDPEWRGRLFARVSTIVEAERARLLCAGSTRDHVHFYLEVPATRTVAELIQIVKAGSCRWIRQSFPHRARFDWQSGYAAFSVTPRGDDHLMDYIRHQEHRHRERDFAGEYMALLEQHGMEFDLRTVLD